MSAEVVGVRGEDGRVEARPKGGSLTVSAISGRRWLAPAGDPGSLPRSYSLPGSSASGLPPLCAATGQSLKSPSSRRPCGAAVVEAWRRGRVTRRHSSGLAARRRPRPAPSAPAAPDWSMRSTARPRPPRSRRRVVMASPAQPIANGDGPGTWTGAVTAAPAEVANSSAAPSVPVTALSQRILPMTPPRKKAYDETSVIPTPGRPKPRATSPDRPAQFVVVRRRRAGLVRT